MFSRILYIFILLLVCLNKLSIGKPLTSDQKNENGMTTNNSKELLTQLDQTMRNEYISMKKEKRWIFDNLFGTEEKLIYAAVPFKNGGFMLIPINISGRPVFK